MNRHKGFVTAVQHLRNTVTEIVDLTVVFSGGASIDESETDLMSPKTSVDTSNESPLVQNKTQRTPFYSTYLPLLDPRRHQPDVLDLLNGSPPAMCHVHIDVIPISHLPLTDQEIRKWLHERWDIKEKLIKHFHLNGVFPTTKNSATGEIVESNYMVPVDTITLTRSFVFWIVFGGILIHFIGLYSPVMHKVVIGSSISAVVLGLVLSVVLKAR